MTFTRSFPTSSYWNTPLPVENRPIASNSAQMIADQAKVCDVPNIQNPNSSWAIPWSEAKAGDPIATIMSSRGDQAKIRVDPNIGEMVGDDAAIVFRDLTSHIEIGTFETKVPRRRTGVIDTSKPIMCTNFSIYDTNTEGVARQSGGSKQNTGHRGVPPSAFAWHPDEVDAVERCLKVSLAPPCDHPGPNWPMYGIESPRGNTGIPEGARFYKITQPPAGSHPVLMAAWKYGFIVGDTGGSPSLKAVLNGTYPKGTAGLDNVRWTDFAVLPLGWGKP